VFGLTLHGNNVQLIDEVNGLRGEFTSDAGTVTHVVFVFHDLLDPDPKSDDTVWTAQSRLKAWWNDDECVWLFGVAPKSLAPLHAAIMAWVDVWGGV